MGMKIDRRTLTAGLLAAFGAGAAPAFAQARHFGSLARRESEYNTIFVDQEGPYVAMRFGINQRIFTESLYNPADKTEMPVAYTQYMTAALAYTSSLRSILEIGLGGGRTACYLHDFVRDATVTVAELDPEVIALSQQFFGVAPDERLRLVERDGRIFVRTDRERHDVILVDAYRGTFVPFHLTTREFYAVVKSKLNPGGVVAQNIDPETLNTPDVVATMKASFQHVDFYLAEENIVLVAYDGPAKTAAQLNARATALQNAYHLRYPISAMLTHRHADVAPGRPLQTLLANLPVRIQTSGPGRVLTDDFAPVEYQSAITRNNARRN